ncbi:MCP four helix bundle domain-containing protein [Dactylosporangium vinaceum]|uniref:Methyl-accepting chemotaxis protein n=1 Tax=Dactylosporangium vinaceum TaxID=53362 RepID=A0ABV5M475_9ACTN|nr:methyl-accepting chemotaxis protein [Dactylosporangium vinaceum]UAB93425.1 MCP four helix bundle domain-containing protein [Dactylosporangium vinaceum]
MARQWTFGQRLGLGFAVTAILTLATGVVTIWALTTVVAGKDKVIEVGVKGLAAAQELRTAVEAKSSAGRAYLLTGDQRYSQQITAARAQFAAAATRVRDVLTTPEERDLLDQSVAGEQRHQDVLQNVMVRRDQPGSKLDEISAAFETNVVPQRDAVDREITALLTLLDQDLRASRDAASARASVSIGVVIALAALSVGLGVVSGLLLARALRRQVAGTAGHIRSSSSQLEAAAAQQATGAREQATAMSEITTTIEELLITSRQIADGAQRVAKIADETATAAGSGDSTIEEARASIAAIRRQVDLIVQHMLELGQRSQQIGGVVDLVSELAEQTNILAINATIEASGAGEWGRRFAVVADEIRKLADRTAGSAKEIRALIDDVRGAVNTTVMATETGAKAVDAGTRQFNAVTTSFQQIADLVAMTTESAREIELSTKQQTTAVEQVNVAVSDTARVTRETESTATQTRQTAEHLTGLSTTLLRLVSADSGT